MDRLLTTRPAPSLRRISSSRGSILLLVLVAVVAMALCTASFLLSMENEHRAARFSGRQQQARYLADSGVAYLITFLKQSYDDIDRQGGLYENTSAMQALLVAEGVSALDQGRLTILAPAMEQGLYSMTRYGLENESAKLNLNTLLANDSPEESTARDRLLELPGMQPAVADAILDWLDDDNLPRDFGAEQSHYVGLDPPYEPRNGAIASLDELLLVRGVTPELLYGLDANQNYQVDENEQSRGAAAEANYLAGELDRGWAAYLTIHSLQEVATPEGTEPINVNGSDLKKLHDQLRAAVGEPAANFIILFRQYPVETGDASQQTVEPSALQMDFEKKAANTIGSTLDFIDARLKIQQEGGGPAQIVQSPWKSDGGALLNDFSTLLDQISLSSEKRSAGRINLNEASRPVLRSVPNLSSLAVDQIINRRTQGGDRVSGDLRHPIWILAKGIVTLEEMKQIDPFITTGGEVYSGQVVGFFDSGSPIARIEVILDRSKGNPRLVSWRDLTRLGPGFSAETLGVEQEP